MSEENKSYSAAERAHLRSEFFATKPTGFTRFMRTCVPFQMWRFLMINLKMIGIIRKSHKGQSH
jgi:Zn-dependent M28 family amino/carboxypeptidase